MTSRRTSVCGLVAGGSVLALVASDALGWALSPELRQLLLGAAGGALIGLGIWSRDDRVTSEGTPAAIRRRAEPPQVDP
ncbi:MAG TPA: hypothetical protein VFH61_17835, partial [Thermoleophilia bacterium]|nr:hypothetical protein [Thermoleophilia bacterium]